MTEKILFFALAALLTQALSTKHLISRCLSIKFMLDLLAIWILTGPSTAATQDLRTLSFLVLIMSTLFIFFILLSGYSKSKSALIREETE